MAATSSSLRGQIAPFLPLLLLSGTLFFIPCVRINWEGTSATEVPLATGEEVSVPLRRDRAHLCTAAVQKQQNFPFFPPPGSPFAFQKVSPKSQ